MKKILLGTTTLVGAAALFAGAAFAGETPKVTIGGTSDFQVGIVDDVEPANSNTIVGTGQRGTSFRNETEVNLKIDAKTDAGLGYGGQIDLDVSNTDNGDAADDQVGKSFIYAEGAWGRLEGGSNYGAAATMKVDASTLARATGGIDGSWNYFFNPSPAATFAAPADSVIATPDLLLDYGATQFGDESQEAIHKVTYYTPRFMGFQAGVSYLVDSSPSDQGTTVTRTAGQLGEASNVWVAGINYQGNFEGFGINLAGTTEQGTAENPLQNDLETWNVGAKVDYMGFSIAGSYGDWGDSLQTKATTDDSADYWTLGAAYEYGPFGASVTYLTSTFDTGPVDNKFSNISVGVDYKLAPGLTPYAEVSFIDMTTNSVVDRNDGTVFIAGTQLAF